MNFFPVDFSAIDEVGEIRRRMRVSNLEARLALHEIDAEALLREIKSPLTSGQRRAEATQRRETALNEVSAILTVPVHSSLHGRSHPEQLRDG